MNLNSKEYYIVDFIASRKYFHQYPLIIGLSQFLSKRSHSPVILLPYIADKLELESSDGAVNYILDSGYSSRNSRPMRHLILKLLTILCGSQSSGQLIKRRMRKIYIAPGLAYFQNIKSSTSKHIVFPTLDPLSLELALRLSTRPNMKEYYFYFRIVGSESRGILSSGDELKLLLNLVNLHPNKIRIGVETIGYKTYLENLGFDPSFIFWSPWPCLDNFDKTKSKNNPIKIGFLGCAKQRKGFDNIPKIISQLKMEGVDFDILIQEANFPWAGYVKTKNDIEAIMGCEFKFLPSNLELIELQENVNKCDVLILPYDTNSYSINASGVLYHACDSSVPIVTAKGVGFTAEIEKFNLGLAYVNLDEIPEIVKKIRFAKFGFLNYNSERIKANNQFLFSRLKYIQS